MWYAIVAILILIADQGLKYWVTLNIPLDTGHVTLIPGVLELTNIHNNGAAFSILQHAPHWLFVIFTVVFAAIAVFWPAAQYRARQGRPLVGRARARRRGRQLHRPHPQRLRGRHVQLPVHALRRVQPGGYLHRRRWHHAVPARHLLPGRRQRGGRARAEEGAQVPSAAPGRPCACAQAASARTETAARCAKKARRAARVPRPGEGRPVRGVGSRARAGAAGDTGSAVRAEKGPAAPAAPKPVQETPKAAAPAVKPADTAPDDPCSPISTARPPRRPNRKSRTATRKKAPPRRTASTIRSTTF